MSFPPAWNQRGGGGSQPARGSGSHLDCNLNPIIVFFCVIQLHFSLQIVQLFSRENCNTRGKQCLSTADVIQFALDFNEVLCSRDPIFDYHPSPKPFRDRDKITAVEVYDSILFYRSHEYRRKFQIIMHCTGWRVLFLNNVYVLPAFA